jgi:ubiquitin-conjugating enzyme E2 variant
MLRSTRLPLAAESCPLIDPVSPVAALDHQPPWLTALKGTAVAFSCVLLFRLAWRVGAVTVIDGWYWPVAVAIVLGYASADFVSGSVHWFCDTFFSPRTPVVGPVIFRFRNHHDNPQHIVQLRFLEQDINNFFLMMPPLAWLWWSDLPATGRPWALFGSSFLLALSCGVGATNMLHKWAHDPAPPAAAKWLQRRGLILSPERHWVHHQDHSRGFCVTSGWMNRLLDPIRFFPRLERCMRSMLPAPMTGSDPGVDHR